MWSLATQGNNNGHGSEVDVGDLMRHVTEAAKQEREKSQNRRKRQQVSGEAADTEEQVETEPAPAEGEEEPVGDAE